MSAARAGRGAPGQTALLLALLAGAPAVAAAEDEHRPWFAPDHLKLQLAGDIGFVSPGIGYELAGRRLHLDLFLGWVPAGVGGHDIYSATAKVTYVPWHLRVFRRWLLQPLTAGVQLTRTFGSQYFVTSPSRYPGGYYDVPTALHGGVALGAGALRQLRGDREAGFYVELVGLASELIAWRENRGVLRLSDVLSVALGARLRF